MTVESFMLEVGGGARAETGQGLGVETAGGDGARAGDSVSKVRIGTG